MASEPGITGGGLRLHPVSLLFTIGSAARRLLIPGILVLIASRGSNMELWFMLLFIPALLAALARYVSFRYRLGPDEMVVREGVVTRNERHIRYDRIQNIDLVRNPLHRMFGVAEVRIETAGGEKPEAVIRVLALDAIEHMRARVFSGRDRESGADAAGEAAGTAREAAPARVVHHLPSGEVALFGVISNQGMVVVAAALGLMWQFDVMDGLKDRLGETRLNELKSIELNWIGVALAGIVGLIAFVVLLRVLSVAWAFLKLHGFELRRRGNDLRAEYGLFTRVSKTIPRNRVQLVSTRETALHRWFGRAAVQVETAGGGGDDEGSSTDKLWLAPLIRRGGIRELVREAMPGLDLDEVQWEPVAQRAWKRIFRRTLIVPLAILAGTAWTLRGWAIVIPLFLLPLIYLHARLWVRHAGWAVTPEAVLYRSGWWVRRLSAVRFAKIQSLQLMETPFDRRHGMAGLQVDTAGAGRVSHGIDVPFLEADVARRLQDRLGEEAARRSFRW